MLYRGLAELSLQEFLDFFPPKTSLSVPRELSCSRRLWWPYLLLSTPVGLEELGVGEKEAISLTAYERNKCSGSTFQVDLNSIHSRTLLCLFTELCKSLQRETSRDSEKLENSRHSRIVVYQMKCVLQSALQQGSRDSKQLDFPSEVVKQMKFTYSSINSCTLGPIFKKRYCLLLLWW